MGVHTGFAQGHEPGPTLAQRAVAQAMSGVRADIASSVLLFLTSPFNDPQAALKAAARSANCTQIMGCVAPGIFTERESAINVPAAAAMVLTGGLALKGRPVPDNATTLVLAAMGDVASDWRDANGSRFGVLTVTGMPLWCNGRVVNGGYCEAAFQGVNSAVGVATGIRMLGDFSQVTAVQGHDLVFLGGKPALQTLQQAWPQDMGELVLNRLMACVADSEADAMRGQFQTRALMGGSEDLRSVTLSQKVEPGQWLCWGLRDEQQVESAFGEMLSQVSLALAARPDFGILFSCLGRSPLLEVGTERDVQLLRRQFTAMPLIGVYGVGEVAPLNNESRVLQHAAVLGLFAEHP